ncbi:flagellar basal-body MS-ring/collar protein FliF [Shouchella clausii]|uniref:flagellar basal-body MS-ring/collar protein FliF n=1 Tax=Shouchella clausii TaxID=79880 RepID=UPI002148BE64|nr:flagellar basal-body MS-ring/collar protein FliF [Shouchella clausii]MCR1286279.1 flagellar M-ring protein FliF [Shouchella clausii]
MKEKAKQFKNQVQTFWTESSTLRKSAVISVVLLLLLAIALAAALLFRTNYAPLYSQLTLAEAGQIQEALEQRGVAARVSNDGTTIHVPEADVDRLKVDLAAEGLPKSGSIDYAFFQNQMGFGMTDNEFTVIERSLMQTELAELIRGVQGVEQANVIITLPEESVWLNSGQESSTAAVVLQLEPGYTLDSSQVKALYHLISKSVPNLPIENIVLSDSQFNNYTYQEEETSPAASFQSQREIKQEIESDLKQTINQLLSAVVGPENAIVSVTADIDFTQEQRTEDLVEPVDEEEVSGLAISVERINEMYEGTTGNEEGVAGVGDEIPNYTGAAGGGDSESERTEERINYEVNRIHREIIESPYEIRDLGIQVMVNPPEGMQALPPQQTADITAMLETIIRTTLPDGSEEEGEQDVGDRVVVTSMPFAQTETGEAEQPAATIPVWIYAVAAGLVLLIIILAVLLYRKREPADLAEEQDEAPEPEPEQEDEPLMETEETEESKQMRQLNRLAKEQPEDFSKLLRTWLSDE